MKIKYNPCKRSPETQLKYIDEWSIEIDSKLFEFSPEFVEYPNVSTQSELAILDAKVVDGELYLTVVYFYAEKMFDINNPPQPLIWEDPNYYPEGGYKGSRYEDFGKDTE